MKKTKEISDDLIKYIAENIADISENHIDSWKNRYFRKSKKEVRFDLEINHDPSLEIEGAEEFLGRKITDKEKTYLIKKFNSQVVKTLY